MKKLILLALLLQNGNQMYNLEKTANQINRHVLDALIRKSKTPGIQYVVVDSNSTIMDYASGFADIKQNIRLEPRTTMMAYSMTKTFTAVAILQLVGSGKIGIDDPVIKYLPDIPYGDEITVRQLLTHTSGIPNPVPLRWVHPANQHAGYNEAEALAQILKKNNRLSFEPGEKYAYSNIGYWLLGKIIERTTQLTYAEYMSQYFFNKLGVKNRELSFEIVDTLKRAKGYLAKYSFFNVIKRLLIDDELIGDYEKNWLHIKNHYLNGTAFGGLIGSARDIALFLQDQLKTNSAILGAEMKSLLYSQHKDNAGNPIEMTPGWHIGRLEGIQYFYKEGGGGGYHCEMRLYPTAGIGTIMMVNCTNFNTRKYLNKLDVAFISNQ